MTDHDPMPAQRAEDQTRFFEKAGLTLGGHSVLYAGKTANLGDEIIFDAIYKFENGKHIIAGRVAHYREAKWRSWSDPTEIITEKEAEEFRERDVKRGKHFLSRRPFLYIEWRARYKKNKPVEYIIEGPLTIVSGESTEESTP